MLLESENKTYGSFINKKYIPTKNSWDLISDGTNDFFDHTWGWKHTLKNDKNEWYVYMKRHSDLIKSQFPHYWSLLEYLFDYELEFKF